MTDAVLVAGAVGAWLLFAGPLLQAAFELRDETDHQRTVESRPDRSGSVSAWWWLLPPVAIWRHRRLREQFRQRQLAKMGDDELRQALSFSNMATAWLLVAGGALLIALKETWEAGEAVDLPVPLRWGVVVVLAVAAVVHAAVRMVSAGKLLLRGAPGGGRRGALRATPQAAEAPVRGDEG